MLQEEKIVSFTHTHIPRKSNLPKSFSERMRQAIDLASGTSVPVNANSTFSGSYGSTAVAVGTPAQMISDPTGFMGDFAYGLDFDLAASGTVIQKYVTETLDPFLITTYAGYNPSTSTSYKAGTNTAVTYS